jgi:hypothetical protein
MTLPHQALGTMLALLVALLGGCAAAGRAREARGGVEESQKASSPIAPACRPGNPLANVHHPFRLKLIKPCVAVHGTVTSVRRMRDGDFHVNLRLDPGQNHLLNEHNLVEQHGDLVTEIVPADQPGCIRAQPPKPALGFEVATGSALWRTYDFGVCSGATIAPPQIGAHVTVVGPHVLDQRHGWMEIHPVWSVETGVGDEPLSGARRLVPPP